MQIIITMAGNGERFIRAGFTRPKPLIEVDGKPMIEHVVNLFPGEEDFLFICNEKHLRETNIQEILLALRPDAKVLGVAEHNQGPVYSLLEREAGIRNDSPVIVNYCDFNMFWGYGAFQKAVRDVASASVCYRGFHPHLLGSNLYAGVRADERSFALEVREKHSFTENKMDTWQQAGTFYFRSGELLKKYCRKVMNENINHNGEFYVSLLFNPLIQDGYNSLVYPVQYFCQWGTPEDLQAYLYWSKYFNWKSQ